LNQKK